MASEAVSEPSIASGSEASAMPMVELPVSVRKLQVSLSGPCTAALRKLEAGAEPAALALGVEHALAETFARVLRNGAQEYRVRDVLLVGLGIMGLADLLIKLGIRYGSEEAIYLCDEIGYTMARAAINESSLLASRKGKYNKCKNDLLVQTPFFYSHCVQGIQNTKLLKRVQQTGLRNSQLLTSAPTGSTPYQQHTCRS